MGTTGRLEMGNSRVQCLVGNPRTGCEEEFEYWRAESSGIGHLLWFECLCSIYCFTVYSFTALLFYSIHACSSADCISRIRAVYSIYRIYDYSVIDPSGTNITGTSLL